MVNCKTEIAITRQLRRKTDTCIELFWLRQNRLNTKLCYFKYILANKSSKYHMFIISRWYYVKIYFYVFLTCLKHVVYKYSLTICYSIISFDPMCAFTTPSRPRHRKQKACFIKVIYHQFRLNDPVCILFNISLS